MSRIRSARSVAIYAVAGLLAAMATQAVAANAKPADAAARPPATEDDKTLYALGVLISHNLDAFELSSAEFKTVQAGLIDGYNHRATIDAESYGPKLQALQRTRLAAISDHQKQIGQAYLEKAAATPGAVKTASGLVYIPVSVGKGAVPERSDRVNVNYEGKLVDGTVFDSSAKHGGQPATLSLGGVIPCWTEALQLMKVGGKSRVICPAALAYGDRGAMPAIPPGATLEFNIELVDIAPKPAATPGASGSSPDTAPPGSAPPN